MPRRSRDGVEAQLNSFLNLGVRWGRFSTPRPGRFTPGTDPVPTVIGGYVGPRTGLEGCGKSRHPPGFDPRTVQPVASRYTN